MSIRTDRTYRLMYSNRKTKDFDRAVLPTITYASNGNKVDGYHIRSRVVMIGWWAWSVGVMETSIWR